MLLRFLSLVLRRIGSNFRENGKEKKKRTCEDERDKEKRKL